MFNNVVMPQEPSPQLGLSQRQINAKANTLQAQGDMAYDPTRFTGAYDRRGFSRGGGQKALGMLQAGNQYAAGQNAAAESRMADAYSNASVKLQDQARRQDFGLALAGLQEQAAHNQWNSGMQLANTALRGLGIF